jgi:hypothetical protein
MLRTLRAGCIIIGSPLSTATRNTRLLRPKKEAGSSSASSARLLRVKEEGNPPPPFAKKTRISIEEQL